MGLLATVLLMPGGGACNGWLCQLLRPTYLTVVNPSPARIVGIVGMV